MASDPVACPCVTAPCREAAMVVTRRDADGRPSVWCDPCIAPLVDALNQPVHMETVGSCCGHGKGPGWVGLADGRVLVIHVGKSPTDAVGETLSGAAPVLDQEEDTDAE